MDIQTNEGSIMKPLKSLKSLQREIAEKQDALFHSVVIMVWCVIFIYRINLIAFKDYNLPARFLRKP